MSTNPPDERAESPDHPPSPVEHLRACRRGALAASLMPPNVRRALAQAPRTGQLSDIKHVVLLMQENRSFDHYFGTMAGVRGFDDPDALAARRTASRSSISPTPRIRTATCCRFISTRARPARKKFRRPATPGRCSTPRGTAARWTTGCPAHRKADGDERPLRDGLPHARRHSVSIRAGRGVHDLRRLSLLGVGPDVAEPHVLDDRHDRPRRRSTAGR